MVASYRLVGVSILAAVIASVSDGKPLPDGGGVFVGYVNSDPRGVDLSLYTHLCHSFVVADADGRVKPNPSVPDTDFARRAHARGVKVLISLGGWGWDHQFAQMVLDPAAEQRYVASVLQLVDEADYDGLDLDWEYPDSREEIPGFERLTTRLRKGLDELGRQKGRPMVLTMAAGAHPRTLAWLDTPFILANFDWINIMTYDYAGSWTEFAGHHSPMRPSGQVPKGDQQAITVTFEYLLSQRGLPPERLALGIPLYGRAFSVERPYGASQGTQGAGRSVTAGEIRALLAQGWTREWDAETQTPWLRGPEGDEWIGYDDEESVAAKTRWAKARGLLGVFFWEVSHDRTDPGAHPIQEAAKQAWVD